MAGQFVAGPELDRLVHETVMKGDGDAPAYSTDIAVAWKLWQALPRPKRLDVDAERVPEPLIAGDTLVLCTDGLHGVVEDGEIAKLASHPSLDEVCRSLIDLANTRGGPDNITVVVARIEPEVNGAKGSA